MQSLKLRLFSHLMGAWQFRWFGLVAAFIVCGCTWFSIALIPNIFESGAKVYIDTDTLLRPLLRGLAVTTDADQQVNVMLRTLLSSTNVEQVVRATDPNAATASTTVLREKVVSIQQRVVLKDLGTANLYAISFRDADPRYAQAVTQSLLSVLIDSNLGNQRQDSDSARNFLDSQIQDYERKLTTADKRRADFKAAHLDFFDSASDNSVDVGGGVVQSANAVTQAQTALDEAVARRNSIRSEAKATQATLDVNAPAAVIFNSPDASASSPYTQLAQAKARLSDLRTRYTEEYPDVVATRNLIARLQAEIASTPANSQGANGRQGISNPAYVALKSRLADEEANVAVAQQRLASAQRRVALSKNNAVDALSVQREYEDLNRDYQVLHENYQQLVSRRESANISQAAGSQQSAIFRVIDPPLRPTLPISPNRPLLNLVALLAGLVVGAMVALGLSVYQDRFLSAEQLTEAFAIPVIGIVTASKSPSDLARDRQATLIFAGALGVLFLGYMTVLLLFHSHLAIAQANI